MSNRAPVSLTCHVFLARRGLAQKSIAYDAQYVAEVRGLYPQLPLLANLRCGLWYHPQYDGTCYFKSSDGHRNQWQLNHRRLNLHLLAVVRKAGGCLVVDSTSRGKWLPDSYSKTIPMWAATINRVAVRVRRRHQQQPQQQHHGGGQPPPPPTDGAVPPPPPAQAACESRGAGPDPAPPDTLTGPEWFELHTPLRCVDAEERAAISARLDGWVDAIMASAVDVSAIAAQLTKPLRPLWLTPDSLMFVNMMPDFADCPFHPVVCVSASQPPGHRHRSPAGFEYMQGCADDEETWARGLTPNAFWLHHTALLAASEAEVAQAVDAIVMAQGIDMLSMAPGGAAVGGAAVGGAADNTGASAAATVAMPGSAAVFNFIGGTGIAVGGRRAGRPPQCWANFDAVINVTMEEYPQDGRPAERVYLQMAVLEGKKDKRELEQHLPAALRLAYGQLCRGGTVLVHCAQGKDRQAPTFSLFFDEIVPFHRAWRWAPRLRLPHTCMHDMSRTTNPLVPPRFGSTGRLRSPWRFWCRFFPRPARLSRTSQWSSTSTGLTCS